jgi:hypothetical protein
MGSGTLFVLEYWCGVTRLGPGWPLSASLCYISTRLALPSSSWFIWFCLLEPSLPRALYLLMTFGLAVCSSNNKGTPGHHDESAPGSTSPLLSVHCCPLALILMPARNASEQSVCLFYSWAGIHGSDIFLLLISLVPHASMSSLFIYLLFCGTGV